ncbi:MAG: LysR substrate-binding domain-containing protein [Telluria sp.]
MNGLLDDFAVFLAILDHGSLTAAARASGRSLQAVSRSLTKLERDLGVQLIQRTTRSLRPTLAGSRFEERIRKAVADLEAARLEIRLEETVVAGTLRIGAPPLFASEYLVDMVRDFMQRHPAVEVELVLSDRRANLVEERLDLALRIGDLPDSSLRARHLADLRRVIFASPGWLAKHGRPTHPNDLVQLPCVVRTFGPERAKWPVTIEGAIERIEVRGSFNANDAASCNRAVLAGLGAGLAPFWQVRRHIDDGSAEMLLDEYAPPPVLMHAIWPNGRRLPLRTRLFIDFLVASFAGQRW